MKKTLPLLAVLLAAGCDRTETMVEQAPPREQKVVMVPAVGGGRNGNAQGGTTGQAGQPAPNPNSTPDGRQPGDK